MRAYIVIATEAGKLAAFPLRVHTTFGNGDVIASLIVFRTPVCEMA